MTGSPDVQQAEQATRPDALRRGARRGLLAALIWPAGLLLGVLALSRLDLDDAWLARLDLGASPGWLAVGVASLLLVFPAMGRRWQALIPGQPGSGLMLGAIAGTGQLLSVVLPGPVGELAAALIVQRRYDVPTAMALAAGFHARVLGLVAGVVVAALTWFVAPVALPAGAALPLGLGAAVIASLIGVLAALAWWPDVLLKRELPGVFDRPGRIGDGVRAVWTLVRDFVAGASAIGRGFGRGHAIAMGWSLVLHVSAGFGVWAVALGLGLAPTLSGVLLTQGAVSAGAIVLFLLPGREVGWDAAFAAFLVAAAGLDPGPALALTGVSRALQVALMALGPLLVAAAPEPR